MATKRTTFLKRQKEQKRLEKAAHKQEKRMLRRQDKSGTGVLFQNADQNQHASD